MHGNGIPDHPAVAMALATGYPRVSRGVKCTDCENEFFGGEKMYMMDGDLVCGGCAKDRILDAHGVADLAHAFDIYGARAEDFAEVI